MTNTASNQTSSDPAGEGMTLAKAFEAAIGSTDLDEAEFQEAATSPKDDQPEESTTEPATEGEPGGEEQEAAGETPPVTEGQESALQAPANWDAQRREAFGKLDANGQKLALDIIKGYEAEFTRNSQTLAEESKYAQGVKSLITDQHRQQLRSSGMSEIDGFSRLLQLNDAYTQNPTGYLRWAFQASHLDPRQVFPEYFAGNGTTQAQPAPNGAPQRPQPDPNQQALLSTLNPLFQQVQGLQQEIQRSKTQAADRAIASFKDAKATDGALMHPHLPVVEREMISLLNSPTLQAIEDPSQRLQRAYDIAVANNDGLRTQTLEAEVQKRIAAQQAADRQKQDVAKARKAKAPVRAAPTTEMATRPKGLGDILKQTMSDAGV